MLLRLADFPNELVVKTIDLIPREDIGHLRDVNDYSFQEYYSDSLIMSGNSDRSPNLIDFWEQETRFGHLHDINQMAKFDRVELMKFIKESESHYIPKNLSFESPYDFLTFGKHFPEVLSRALTISFENYEHQLKNMDLRDYRITSLTCDYDDNSVFPITN